jgi:hypothetical protein
MAMSIHTTTFLPRAAEAAMVRPFWHQAVLDGRRIGNGSALAERWQR